jgi:hypothetical protein
MQRVMTVITEQEFLSVATEEDCHANLDERFQATSPTYTTYLSLAQDFLKAGAFPPWRVSRDANEYVGAFEVSREEAFPISYSELSNKPNLFMALTFDPQIDYLKTNRIICFHCRTCGVRLVKDGNHRLLQCALRNVNPEIRIFELSSTDWSASQVDMKNFCNCIYNKPLKNDARKNARAS